jgi:hypothetical protein
MKTPPEKPGGWILLRRAAGISLLLVSLQLIHPAASAFAAAAKPATKIVNVADTRKIPPGPTRWIADLYNTSYWQFGLLVVVLMAGMGIVLGYGCDRLVSLLGINLGKMQHHE